MSLQDVPRLEQLLENDATHCVEARGTWCPEPLTRLQGAAASVAPGEVLALIADDPVVEVDVNAWCISTGNEYLGSLRRGAHLVAFVRRRERGSPGR